MQHREKKDLERARKNVQRTFLIVRHHIAVAKIAECLLRRSQYRGAFTALLPAEKNNILIVKTSLCHWLQGLK
jgi:hypothetical protein